MPQTVAEVFTLLEALVRTFPVIRDAMRMLLGGHPAAKRVRDVLEEEDGESAAAAARVRAGGR